METNFSSSIIANYFLLKDKSMKNDVMKVLKLVYISHGFHLALTNDPLIKENVMAWQYGPVIPELYFQLKADNLQCFQEEQLRLNENNKLHQFLDLIYEKYKKFNGIQLSDLTHQKGTPWDITVNNFKSQIDNELIKTHYLGLLKK